MTARLDAWLRRPLVILDGGMGTELEARGHDLSDALWSARLLAAAPEAIVAVHRDYLEAGADCIVTASYQATFERLAQAGFGTADAERLLQRAVDLALAARGTRDAMVAASVGPYAGMLADGSEFTGVYDRDEDALYEWHERRFALLAASGADMLACETIPSFAEARALARLLTANPATRAWLSFCCRDDQRISDGTPLAECVAALAPHPQVVAIGVNCTAPLHVEGLVRIARAGTDKPIVAYPNSGETWDAIGRCWTGTRDAGDFTAMARHWRAAGASWLGGCCRTRPEHIRQVAALLR